MNSCQAAILLLLSVSGAANAAVLYVDASATGQGDGSSWNDAYTDLSIALSAATAGDEVRVAAGIYRPSEIPGDREASFTLVDGVRVFGGFAQGGSDAADWETNLTILSGDIEGDDLDFDGDGTGINQSPSEIVGENSLHVVTVSGTSSDTVLDGFVITAGSSGVMACDTVTPPPHCSGGGMLNVGGSPVLSRLWFSANFSTNGGGVANLGGSPTFTDVRFTYNDSSNGGAVVNLNADPTFTRVIFESNFSGVSGGAMVNRSSSPSITSSVFKANRARMGGAVRNFDSSPLFEDVRFELNGNFPWDDLFSYGGAMNNLNSHPTLVDVAFEQNFVGYDGGAIYNGAASTLTMNRVRFDLNSAGRGAGTHGGAIHNTGGSGLRLDNGFFRGNRSTAVVNIDAGDVSMINVVFSANWNTAILGSGTTLSLVNASFAGNAASPPPCNAVNLFGASSLLTISNSIMWGGFSGASICAATPGNVVINHSLIEGCKPGDVWSPTCGVDGGGNVADVDPLFLQMPDTSQGPSVSGNLRLRAQSPARDVGDNAANPLLVDLDGLARIDGPFIDLGAYEWRWTPEIFADGFGPSSPKAQRPR